MSYNEPLYLFLFLPLVLIIYNLFPKKYRTWILLFASYIFFWSFSGKLLVYLLISTLSIHHLGIWMDDIYSERNASLEGKEKEERKEIKKEAKHKAFRVLMLGVLIHLGTLVLVKYTPFFKTNLNTLFKFIGLNITLDIPKILMPIGISFYTMEALSYIIDVYNEKIKADRNLMNLALYLSFFPQTMEGPIARYSETVPEITKCENSTIPGIRRGLLRIGYGLVKKIVIADRLNSVVRVIFNGYEIMDGGMVLLGAILYTIQLYSEFSGVIDIVIGSSECFGIRLPENFKQPFFSKSISEFWKRWHITLGAWFKDYIFYPLSLCKPMKHLTMWARKHIGSVFGPLLAGSVALFCVWISNGLWHGAGWNYIFFGFYHFVLIVLGNILDVFIKKFTEKHNINRDSWYIKPFRILKTTILVIIGEMFFRANTLTSGFVMFKNLFTNFTFDTVFSKKLFTYGIDLGDLIIVGITLIIVLVVSILKEKNVDIREKIESKPTWIRWICYYLIIFYIIIFGAYGTGYTHVDPIYANF